MRIVIAVASVLLALPASAQDQKIVSVWEGYEFRTDGGSCESLVGYRLSATNGFTPLCEYQHINNLLRDGWIVNHSISIKTRIQSGKWIEGCYVYELSCVGRRYFLTRATDYQPPAPSLPELKHIRVPEALGQSSEEPAAASE